MDPIPEIHIDAGFQNLDIEINGTSQTAVFPWEINATDPYYPDWKMDSNESNRGFELEGNFTPYLIGLPVSGYEYNSTMEVDLELVPPGKYSLYYTAFDSFQNYSKTVEQNITISDKQPPFLTIIDFVTNTGVTTEQQSTFSDIYPDYNSTSFTYLSQLNASADLNWSMGTPFNLEDLYIEARDNKSGTSAWNVTSDGSSFTSIDTNSPQSYELNFTTEDDAGNIANLILYLHVIDDYNPVIKITGQSLGENIS